MSIANLENVVSNAERRALLNGETWIVPRVSDLAHLGPSARGKLELTMTEDDGQEDKLVDRLVAEAVKNVFAAHFDPKDFRPVIDYFEGGKGIEVGDTLAVKARARPHRKGAAAPQEGRGVRPQGPARAERTRGPRRLDGGRRGVYPGRAARPQQAEQDGQGGAARRIGGEPDRGHTVAETLAYPEVDEALLAEVVRRILEVGSPQKIILFGSHRGATRGRIATSIS